MQESNYLKLVDNNYRLRQSKQYHLNVRLTASSFSYNVFDPAQGKFIALFDTRSAGQEINIKPYIEEDDLLKQSFGITRLMFTSGHFLLLPEELYEQEKIDALFKSAFHTVGEVIINNPVKTLNARLLASLEKEEHDTLVGNFEKAYLFHEGGPFITGLQQQYENAEQSFLADRKSTRLNYSH